MTKDEYMKALKNNIQALTLDEQNEALQYYNDYFEEAGDDQKVIQELGTPEELAAVIIERFANAIVDPNGSKKEDNQSEENTSYEGYDALYYSFEKSSVKNLELNFGGAEIVIISGKKYEVETRGITSDNFMCRIDTEGTLVIKNLKKLNGLNFFNHERVTRIVPRILITVPSDAAVEKMKIAIGAGKLETRDINLNCQKGIIDVGAGNCIIKSLHGNNVNIRCGMGNIKITGTLTGRSDIDCGMGAVKLELAGDEKNYSYDAKIGLGDFKFNNEKKSGVCQNCSESKKNNHFSVNCGMGSVIISIQKF